MQQQGIGYVPEAGVPDGTLVQVEVPEGKG